MVLSFPLMIGSGCERRVSSYCRESSFLSPPLHAADVLFRRLYLGEDPRPFKPSFTTVPRAEDGAQQSP